MNLLAIYARFMSLCFLTGVIRATREPVSWWSGIGMVSGCLACAIFWTQANRMDGME